MPLKNKNTCGSNGFTLLEVLVALAVLAVGLLAMAKMQMTAIQGNADASQMTVAVSWARDKMEELLAVPYDAAVLTDTDGDAANGLDDTGDGADQTEAQGKYALFWNVSDNDPVANSKRVRVIVIWQDRGRTRSVRLTCVKPEL